MARRGNFSHPVKLLNLVEDMSSGLQPSAEKPRRAFDLNGALGQLSRRDFCSRSMRSQTSKPLTRV
jgi:hypothetical protein